MKSAEERQHRSRGRAGRRARDWRGGRSALALAGLVVAIAAAVHSPARAAAQDEARRARYVIEATLDERTHVLTGRARLHYTNRAPEPLDRLYFHQYLNAFRPNSAWTTYDLRFGERAFQALGPDDHAFERIHRFAIDGNPLDPVYPGAPDSTVFYIELPAPLPAGGTVVAEMDWTARLATEPRRQGRRGRHYNWAHWYPRIAVYGPDGWEHRAHIRPGELNGTFGTYDVTLDLAADQVLGATGVPVEGDPGWEAAAVEGSAGPFYRRDAYGTTGREPLGLLADPGADRKQVRWRAENVHNFAWSTSPEYRYLGGCWGPGKTPIHLLWEPTSRRWNALRVMQQQKQALDWLRELFGEYAWPQITVTDRIEGGATEFPMLYMTSGGAVVHETMHMVAHGILANNEWREGWLDEGMASFLASWLSEHEGAPPEEVWGRGRETVAALDAAGVSEPPGLPGAEFGSYEMYQTMTYTKGAQVLRMLRDMLGEGVFREGLRDYYQRFRFRQVTGEDFRRSMERASGRDLEWFFGQWIDGTGTLDYAVGDVRLSREGNGYVLAVEVLRLGVAYMPVLVEAGGQRDVADSRDARQTVTFRLDAPPSHVAIDPDRSLVDIDRSNNRKSITSED